MCALQESTHELRKLAKAGHDMTPFVVRCLTQKPLLVVDSDHPDGAVPARDLEAHAPISSEQFQFALECLRQLYDRTYSQSKSSVFRLNAAHFIVAALELCDVSALLSEDVHQCVVDMVHNLLKQAPAFYQVHCPTPSPYGALRRGDSGRRR
jgi:hypothetical protein